MCTSSSFISKYSITSLSVCSNSTCSSSTSNKLCFCISCSTLVNIKTSNLVNTYSCRCFRFGRCLNYNNRRSSLTISSSKLSNVNISDSTIKNRCYRFSTSSTNECSSIIYSVINNINGRYIFITATTV